MYSYGKHDGSFRCSASATGKCWNRVSSMRERVYPAVLEAVVNEVLSLDGIRDAVLARVKELHEKGGAVAAKLKKLDDKEIAQELDLTEYHMENCAAIVRLMEAAGLAEPYRRLTEKPDHVPQWCSKHWLKAGDRKGGGKRRRAS
jgi:hypothetical protein